MKRTHDERSPDLTTSPGEVGPEWMDTAVGHYLQPPPEGVHPAMWAKLCVIQRDVACMQDVPNRVTAIEDQLDNDDTDIALLKHSFQKLEASNKTLCGRLLRAEATIARQQKEITDLKSRSMRDNVIIRTSGKDYRGHRDENTDSTIRKFMKDELKLVDADKVVINSSHRMGVATAEYNRMLIARLPRRCDHERIFSNAKSLQGTNYSISKQVPHEINERRQFAWSEFKKARSEKKAVRFDGGSLIIGGHPVKKFDPVELPTASNMLQGLQSPTLIVGTSEVLVEDTHTFQAWATPASSLYDIREGYDQLLHLPELAGATHAPYAFRFLGTDGRIAENFYSNGDTNIDLSMTRVLKELSADNVVVFLAHHKSERAAPMPRKKMNECLASVIGGAMMAMTAVEARNYDNKDSQKVD